MRNALAKASIFSALALFLLGQTVLIKAQQGPVVNEGRRDAARLLNNRLLEVYARLTSLPGNGANATEQAASIIGERANLLESMIRDNPEDALAFAFSPDLLTELAQAFPVAAPQLESVGEWEGVLEVTIEDDLTLSAHRTRHILSLPDGTKVNLHFKDEDGNELESGHVLRVKGVRVRSEIAAADGGIITGTSVAGAGMCSPLGAQRSIVLLVNMPGTVPPNISTAQVHDIFFSPSGRSVSEFWRENSYGQAWAEGDVKGWYTLDASYSCDQYPTIRDAAVRAADNDVDFSQYNRVFIIISGMTGSCGWAGIANVGCGSSIQSKEGTFVMSSAWMLSGYFSNRDQGVKLSIHEGGHSLGLSHASTRGFGSEPLGGPGVAGTLDEYGDMFSTMGYWNFGHYAAPHKVKLGWMKDYLTVTGSGAFSIQPSESPANLQALKIQRGTDATKFMWLEFRKNIGLYDSTLPAQAYAGGLIHYQDSTTGNKSHLLDFTPSTSSFSDGTLVGNWTDPYSNTSIGITSVTENALGVTVNFGSLPCVQSPPTLALSPVNPSGYPGDQLSYTVSVKNNDSSSCSSRSFTMTSLQPDGWPSTFNSTLLTVQAGSTATVEMKKTIPLGTGPATYPVTAVADSGNAVQGNANLTVKPPLAPIVVTVMVPSSPVRTNSNVAISAIVMQGETGAAGATVQFTVVSPTGATSTKKVTADGSGRADWGYKVNPKAAKGTYTVSARATLGSVSAMSSAATFVVQ